MLYENISLHLFEGATTISTTSSCNISYLHQSHWGKSGREGGREGGREEGGGRREEGGREGGREGEPQRFPVGKIEIESWFVIRGTCHPRNRFSREK